jgi:hypothetical protein
LREKEFFLPGSLMAYQSAGGKNPYEIAPLRVMFQAIDLLVDSKGPHSKV